MKKSNLILILFSVFIYTKTYSQVKIFINKNEENMRHNKNIYTLNKNTDEQYIWITNSQDMGKINNCQYRLNENLPDNEYQIYVNDTLRSIHTFKKDKRKIQKYYKSGNLELLEIDNGVSNKFYKVYYENGKLNTHSESKYKIKEHNNKLISHSKIFKSYYPNGNIKVDSQTEYFFTNYYENGEVKYRTFYSDDNRLVEEYNLQGKIIKTSFIEKPFKGVFKKKYNFKNEVLNGKSLIIFGKLRFILEYDMNKLLYILIEKNTEKIFEKNYR